MSQSRGTNSPSLEASAHALVLTATIVAFGSIGFVLFPNGTQLHIGPFSFGESARNFVSLGLSIFLVGTLVTFQLRQHVKGWVPGLAVERLEIMIAKLSIWTALLSLLHVFLVITPTISRSEFYFIGYFVAGILVGTFTGIIFDNLRYIRPKIEAERLQLPIFPNAILASIRFSGFLIITICMLGLGISFYAHTNDIEYSHLAWAFFCFSAIISVVICLLQSWFEDDERRARLKELYAGHDSMYAVHGFSFSPEEFEKRSEPNFFELCQSVNSEELELLLKSGEDPNRKYERGWTPFMIVVANSDINKARLMLKFGADPNIGNNMNRLPIDYAINYGHREMVELLISAGTRLHERPTGYVTHPLILAMKRRHLDIAHLLLDSGIDVTRSTDEKEDPLRVAEELELGDIAAKIRLKLRL